MVTITKMKVGDFGDWKNNFKKIISSYQNNSNYKEMMEYVDDDDSIILNKDSTLIYVDQILEYIIIGTIVYDVPNDDIIYKDGYLLILDILMD